MSKFSWPRFPENASDFEELMHAIDAELAGRGLKPFQRPLNVAPLLGQAFGWGGNMFPSDHLARMPGYQGDILMAKAKVWYDQTYGEKLKSEMAYGFAPIQIANGVWRVRCGVTYGSVTLFLDRNLQNRGVRIGTRGTRASLNVLCIVENLPQGLVDRLSDESLREVLQFYVWAHEGLQWREGLPRTELFQMARGDYDASTSDLMAHRYGQARWGAQQAIEKTLKGMLSLAGKDFPTGGPSGHNLSTLGKLLHDELEIQIAPALLSLASCSAKVRYAEEPSTEKQALDANHAVLGVFEQLRTNPRTEAILSKKNN